MRIVSLFSGAGGLDLGFERAGFNTRVCVEIDSDCRETIRANRPSWNPTALHGGDITRLQVDELLDFAQCAPEEVDVVIGGPPCQSFSNIGNRLGVKDLRGRLIHHYLRVVEGVRPRAFVFENVQGLLQHKTALNRLTSEFKRLGYSISVRLLNSADYGVPQVRKRVIIMGLKGAVPPAFPKATHADPAAASSNLPAWRTVRCALKQLPKKRLSWPDNYVMQNAPYMKKRIALIRPGQNFHALPLSERPDCWKNGKHQGADTFGRLEWDKPSVTIRTSAYNPTKGRYIHPSEHRGLSTAEMAALQTFPYDYRFFGKFGSVGKQIGNAVPPLLAYCLAAAIRLQIDAEYVNPEIELEQPPIQLLAIA